MPAEARGGWYAANASGCRAKAGSGNVSARYTKAGGDRLHGYECSYRDQVGGKHVIVAA